MFTKINIHSIATVLSGMDAVKKYRKWERENFPPGTHVPIVACTGRSSKKEEDECVQSGCDAHISKPFKIEVSVIDVISLTIYMRVIPNESLLSTTTAWTTQDFEEAWQLASSISQDHVVDTHEESSTGVGVSCEASPPSPGTSNLAYEALSCYSMVHS